MVNNHGDGFRPPKDRVVGPLPNVAEPWESSKWTWSTGSDTDDMVANLHVPHVCCGCCSGHRAAIWSLFSLRCKWYDFYPGIPTTIKTMGVNTATIVYLRVLIIQIGSTIILMVVEAQGLEAVLPICSMGFEYLPR